jgi:hypothetical protein
MVFPWVMAIVVLSVWGTNEFTTDDEKCRNEGGILLSPFNKNMNLSMNIYNGQSDVDNQSTASFNIKNLPEEFMICVDLKIITTDEFNQAITQNYPEKYKYVPGTETLAVFFSKSMNQITTISGKTIKLYDHRNPNDISWKYRSFIVMNESIDDINWTISKNDVTLKIIVVDEKKRAFFVIDCQFNVTKMYSVANLKDLQSEFGSKYTKLKTTVDKRVEEKLFIDEQKFSLFEAGELFSLYKETWGDEKENDILEHRIQLHLDDIILKGTYQKDLIQKIQKSQNFENIIQFIHDFENKYQYKPLQIQPLETVLNRDDAAEYYGNSIDLKWMTSNRKIFQNKVREAYTKILDVAHNKIRQLKAKKFQSKKLPEPAPVLLTKNDPPRTIDPTKRMHYNDHENTYQRSDYHSMTSRYDYTKASPKKNNNTSILLLIFFAILVVGLAVYGINHYSGESNDQLLPDLQPKRITIKHKKSECITVSPASQEYSKSVHYDQDQEKSGEDFNSKSLERNSNEKEQSSISIKHCDEIQFPDNFEAIKKKFNQEIMKIELDQSQKRELWEEFCQLTSEFDRDELITHLMELLQILKAKYDTKKLPLPKDDQMEENIHFTEPPSTKNQSNESI